MQKRFRLWQVALLLAIVCAAIGAGASLFLTRGPSTPADLASYLPDKNATLLYIDVDAMRRSGILNMIAGTKAAEELEYKSFVEQTSFDYRHDLDAIAATFTGDQIFFVLRGHFDWKKLRNYAQRQGGSCRNTFCSLNGSKPQRHISFYPLKSNLMALAVSPDDMAAYQVIRNASHVNPFAPAQPVWVLVPAAVLKRSESLPSGMRAFAIALENAERIIFSVGPDGDHLQVAMNVTCSNPETASTLLVQLENTTNTLRKWLAREHQRANADDLSGVLTAGSFRREDNRVVGQWPLQRAFVDALAGGSY
ncbi:MAG: hypothetical protein M3Y27_30410 [Acidobacteriota bacterium]|nr:hypothetical protein [Acidobacteriota bacterium]